MHNYSETLKALRRHSGFTQRDLSDLSGFSVNSIGNWENEKFIPNVNAYERILNVYGLTLMIGKLEDKK